MKRWSWRRFRKLQCNARAEQESDTSATTHHWRGREAPREILQAQCVSALLGGIEAQVAQSGYTYLERARRVVMIGGWVALLVPTCLEKGPLAPRPDSGHSTKLVRIAKPTGNCSGTLGAKCTVKLFCIDWELLWVQPAVVSAAHQQWIPFAISFSEWRIK